MTKITLALILCAPLLAGGCAEIPVHGDYNARTDFSRLKSFAWRPPEPGAADAPADSAVMEDRIHRSVESALTARGYRLAVPPEAPDFKVTYRYAVERVGEPGAVTSSVGIGLGTGGMGGAFGLGVGSGRADDEQTFSLDVLNAQDERTLWRGFARRPLVLRKDPRRTDVETDRLVKAILDQFPPTDKKR